MFKSGTLLIIALFVAAIAYQVLERVPSDALTVALGVTCGIAASVPVTLGLLIVLLRRRDADAQADWDDREPTPARAVPTPVQPRYAQPALPPPQIIVLAPNGQGQFTSGQFPQNLYGANQLPWLSGQYSDSPDSDSAVDARDWRIIGE